MIQYDKCPVCDNADIKAFLNVKDHSISKEEFQLVECGNCSFTFTQNPPDETSAGKYYESEDYISHSNTNKGLVNKLYHLVRKFMLRRKKNIIQSFTKGKSLLDVGSGTGYFLNYMKKNGYNVHGVEVSDEAKKIARENFGLNVDSPDTFLSQNNTKYDIVSLWHVLEHLYDLDKYMNAFDNALNSEGVLVIAVPNKSSYDAAHYKDYWAAYDVPRHLWHFTPKTMRFLANKYNFELISMKKLPFDAFYNCLLSEKYKSNSLALFSGFIHGFISYINSVFSVTKSSSIVYILKSKK